MGFHLSALVERVRASLFFVPMLFVAIGMALGSAMVEADAALTDRVTDLPFVLTSTVESAREVLGVVASATITVAGIAFSVSLLVIQQAANQYSPRVVHTLFRDAFNRRVMGVAVGTFTYCLMVLRAVRGSLSENGEPVIPNLSVSMSVVLGVAAILAIVAFIDHNAHTMEVSQILGRVTHSTIEQISDTWPDEADQAGPDQAPPEPVGPGHTIVFRRSGWLQQISDEALFELVPDRGVIRLETAVGRFAVTGTPLCTVWPAPEDPDVAAEEAMKAIRIGPVRTLQEDTSYGIRQLADVALVALSPGVNDPTTAQEAIFHLAEVLREVLVRGVPPAAYRDDCGRWVLHGEADTDESLVELAFDEIRRTGAGLPTVCIYILEALHLLDQALKEAGHPERGDVLKRQADLVLAGSQQSDVLPEDHLRVEQAYAHRFGSDAG